MLLLAFLSGISWHGSPPCLQLLRGRVCANSSAPLTSEGVFARSRPQSATQVNLRGLRVRGPARQTFKV